MSYKPNIELLKKGDRIELTLFYSNYYDNVKKIVLSNNGTSMDVDDLYQDALMVLITYLRDPSFILNVELKTYYLAIVKYKWYSELKRRKKPLIHLDDVEIKNDDLELSDIDEKEQKLALMESVFSNLKEDCRQVLSLFYFESKSMRDIASIMHLDENFVRLKKFRCLQYLKELIIKHT
mgnify:CR=1 FL=1